MFFHTNLWGLCQRVSLRKQSPMTALKAAFHAKLLTLNWPYNCLGSIRPRVQSWIGERKNHIPLLVISHFRRKWCHTKQQKTIKAWTYPHTPHTYKTVGTKFIQWADAIGNDKNLRQPCNALSVWNMRKRFEFTLWDLLPWTWNLCKPRPYSSHTADSQLPYMKLSIHRGALKGTHLEKETC